MKEQKVYLGDGAYAEFQGYCIAITAENGVEATDTVVIEPVLLQKLVDFARTSGWKID